MHRSGTSCLAGTLQQASLCLGEVSTHNKFNLKGNRENPDVMRLNNSLLQFNGGDWDKPTETTKWDNTHLESANSIISQFETNCSSQHWGFKDPRILLTYPFWEHIFPNATLIGTIRNPIDVAQSLNRRENGPTIDEGLELWLSHNKQLLNLLKNKPFPLISFDYSSNVYQERMEILLSNLFPNAELIDVNFFDNSLRTTPNELLSLPKQVEACYAELQTYLS